MARLERRLFVRSVGIGVIVTTGVLIAGALGRLDSLENWLYDKRALHCQLFSPAPTTRIAFLDIDDVSLETIGRWPWPRATMARILREVDNAKPAALSLDILLVEPQQPRIIRDADGKFLTIDDDDELSTVLRQNGNAVLATSFKVEANDVELPGAAKAQQWFTSDLELTPEAFHQKLNENGMADMADATISDLYIRSRRLAMKARIDAELTRGAAREDALIRKLLPNTDSAISSPILRLLSSQYELSKATIAVARFGTPSQTLTLPAVHGTLSSVPTTTYSSVAQNCAFANYNIFDNPVVRYVPMYVEFDHRLYPQFGLATACAILGAKPADARFEGSKIIIPAPGGDLTIPTSNYYSRPQGRDVPLIAAVPWIGTDQWQTMYDWPAHKRDFGHVSVANVWDICSTEDKLAKNNANVDEAISQIMSNDRPDKLSLNPELAKAYASKLPAPMDIESRQQMVTKTLEELKQSHWIEEFQKIPEAELSVTDKFQRDKLYDAFGALNKLPSQNRQLGAQLDMQRRTLITQFQGKGVLFGFTAEGFQDRVITSLHMTCPGVVVHSVIANAVLTGRWWRTAPPWVSQLFTVFFGIGISVALGWFSPLRGASLMLFVLSAYAIINGFVFFAWQRWIVGAASPMVAIVAVWACVTLYHLVAETIERYRIATEVAIINKEMDLARQVQVALIPAESPKVEGLEVEGWALPASVTGGDCYDLWQLADGRLAIVVADASGHGLAPAMIVSQVRTLMRALCDLESHPHGLLARVNARVASDLEANRFITAFLGFITADGKLDWASAGHGPMYWCSASGEEILELESTGMPLGIQTDWLADDPSPALQLNTSGMLVVFSDGINESRSPSGEMFGTDRVQEIIRKHSNSTSAEVIAAIRTAVQAFQEKTEPIDDQTVVVVRRIQKPQSS